MKSFIILLAFISFKSFAIDLVATDFSLKPAAARDCEKYGPQLPEEKALTDIAQKLQDEEIIVIYSEKMETLGMSPEAALLASRDSVQSSGCSSGHDQGDLANRWCHSALARTFSSILEKHGVSKVLASVAGGVFWAPKEFFYDLHPSAGDFVMTYSDKLGTKRATFEVTVYGDAFFKHRPFEKLEPFKASTPFITFRRKLGPAVE